MRNIMKILRGEADEKRNLCPYSKILRCRRARNEKKRKMAEISRKINRRRR